MLRQATGKPLTTLAVRSEDIANKIPSQAASDVDVKVRDRLLIEKLIVTGGDTPSPIRE